MNVSGAPTLSFELRSFIKAVSSSIGSHGLALLISFAGSVVLTRYLGAEGRGVVAWIMALNAIGVGLAQVGMMQVNRRYGAENSSHVPELFWMTVLLSIGASFLILPALYGISRENSIANQHGIAFFLGMAGIPLGAIGASWSNLLIGMNKNAAYNIVTITHKAANTVMVLVLALGAWLSPLTAVLALVLAFAARMLGCMWYMRGCLLHYGINLRWLFGHIKRYMVSSYFASVLMLYSAKVIPVYMGIYVSAEEVGWYAASTTLLDALIMLPTVLSMYLVPRLTTMHEVKMRRQFMIRIYAISMVGMSVGCGVLYVLSSWLVVLLFGEAFRQAVPVFQVSLIGLVFFTLVLIQQGVIAARHNGWVVMASPCCMAIVSQGAVMLWIEPYGALGGTWVWSCSAAVTALFSGVLLWRVKEKY